MEKWLVYITLVAALALFINGRWRYDVIALAALLFLALTGVIPHDQAFMGFGHPAVITVAGVLVVSRGLNNGGVVGVLARVLGRSRALEIALLGEQLSAAEAKAVGLVGAVHGLQPEMLEVEALEPIRQGVRRHFGGFAEGVARGLALRHDHGSQYMADDFQKEICFLGIESSPAFVRAPEGNGCAERFIRTLKENLLWVRTFDTVEDLRTALREFRETYNSTWLIERHGFRPPAAVRNEHIQPAALAA